MYVDFHHKDKTVVKPSYLYNGNPYTGKTVYLYCDSPLESKSPYTNIER